jgi:hypothetical protein
MRSPNCQRTKLGAHPFDFAPSLRPTSAWRAGRLNQVERLRTDVTITVSGKRPVTVSFAETTARHGRSRSTCSLCCKVERVVLNTLGKHMRLCRLMTLYLRGLRRHRVRRSGSNASKAGGELASFPLASSRLKSNNVRTMGAAVVSDVAWASVKTSLASESGSAWDCHSLWVCSSHAGLVSAPVHCKSTT